MDFEIGDIIVIKDHLQLKREFGKNYANEHPIIADEMYKYLGKKATIVNKWKRNMINNEQEAQYLYNLDICDGYNWIDKWFNPVNSILNISNDLFEI